jgi:hypothetical protein
LLVACSLLGAFNPNPEIRLRTIALGSRTTRKGSVATLQEQSDMLQPMLLLAPSVSGLFKWRQFEPEMILLAIPLVVSAFHSSTVTSRNKRYGPELWPRLLPQELQGCDPLESLKGKTCCRQVKFYSGVYALA